MASHQYGINTLAAAFVAWAILVASPVYADVQEFTDKDEWIAAVGEFTTVDFTGFPEGTFITDQYADLGVLFTDGNDTIQESGGFIDGHGLRGSDTITIAFDSPEAYLAVDFPGDIQIDLFAAGKLIYSAVFIAGGKGNFAGLVSTELFESAFLSDPVIPSVFIDDLYFGPPACPWDLDDNGIVGASDLLALLAAWGVCDDPANCPADFDNTNVVGTADLLALLANWGPCP